MSLASTDNDAHAGYPTRSSTFLPFGQEWNPQTTVNHYKFTGYERDGESGNDYVVARYFSSQYGRFLSADPLAGDITDPQSLNRYAYVGNNPLNFVDPWGMCAEPTATSITVCADPIGIGTTYIYSPGSSGSWAGGSGLPDVCLSSEGGIFMSCGHNPQTPSRTASEVPPPPAAKPSLAKRILVCTEKKAGLIGGTAVAGSLGANVPKSALGVGSGLAGASGTTSVSGAVGFSLFGASEPTMGVRLLGTTRVFGFVGRAAPYVAAALAVVDVAAISKCASNSGGNDGVFGGGSFGGAGASGSF